MMALLHVNLHIFSYHWYFYMLLTPLYQPVKQKRNLMWEHYLHAFICLAHPSQPAHQDPAHCTSLSLSLAHQLLCPSSSLCHNNMLYFPTPIHLAMADPGDEGMLILQNASKYSLNDRVPPSNNLFFNTTVRISTAAQSSCSQLWKGTIAC